MRQWATLPRRQTVSNGWEGPQGFHRHASGVETRRRQAGPTRPTTPIWGLRAANASEIFVTSAPLSTTPGMPAALSGQADESRNGPTSQGRVMRPNHPRRPEIQPNERDVMAVPAHARISRYLPKILHVNRLWRVPIRPGRKWFDVVSWPNPLAIAASDSNT